MRGLPALLVSWALPFIAACATMDQPWSFRNPLDDPYQQLNPDQIEELRGAMELLQEGDLMKARPLIASLVSRAPGDVHAAVWLQNTRIAWGQRRVDRLSRVTEVAGSSQNALRDRYRLEAQQHPTPLAYFLAARLEDDELAAQLLLKEAIELDPNMSWAHYALAHVSARAGDWVTARVELERTFAMQPRHLPALRLYGWLQAEAGDMPGAIAALKAWLGRSSGDLLATPKTRDELQLDLALAYNANGEEERALSLLNDLTRGDVDEVRRLTATAVIEQGRGDLRAASQAIEAARATDPDALMPAVQHALLLELWLLDYDAAKEAWKDVIELASRSDDLGAGVQGFRAEVHLQRLERARNGEREP